MKRLNYIEIYDSVIDAGVMSQVAGIHEFKGKQDMYMMRGGVELTSLADVAKIHSTQSSNSIEGIVTTDERLRKLVAKKARPKNDAEMEIAGYREALSLIFENYENIELSCGSILQVHKILYKYTNSSFAGKFKTIDNSIVDVLPDGSKVERFRPLAAAHTPQAVKDICSSYNEAIAEGLDALVLIPLFVLDFLCIHPFNDGNGRMSRLLTLLLLFKSGYFAGNYISIDRIIDKQRKLYYEALADSSAGWHENKNDYSHFVRFLQGTLLGAYKELDARASAFGASKPKRIESFIKGNYRQLKKTEIMDSCPDISQTTVQRSLNNLVRAKKIKKIGGGRYTYYI